MNLYRIVVVPEKVDLLPFVQRRVMNYFSSDNRLFSVTQVARLTGRSRKRARNEIKSMIGAGYVECDTTSPSQS